MNSVSVRIKWHVRFYSCWHRWHMVLTQKTLRSGSLKVPEISISTTSFEEHSILSKHSLLLCHSHGGYWDKEKVLSPPSRSPQEGRQRKTRESQVNQLCRFTKSKGQSAPTRRKHSPCIYNVSGYRSPVLKLQERVKETKYVGAQCLAFGWQSLNVPIVTTIHGWRPGKIPQDR